jgi:hypothetical protein
MKIKITINEKTIYSGEYEYLEGQSRQMGLPSFFISTHNQKDSGEIEFSAKNLEEIDEMILSLKEERGKMIKEEEKRNGTNKENNR